MAEITRNDPMLSYGKKKPRKKIAILTMAGLLVAGAGIWIYEKYAAQPTASPMILWTAVKRGDVTETVSASGKVQAPKRIELNFSGTGNEPLKSIDVKVGDHVKAGQVLATVDDAGAKLQVANAEANLLAAKARLAEAKQGPTAEAIAMQQENVNKAKAALEAAKTTYEYQKKQYEIGDLPKMQLDQAKNSLDQAQAAYNMAVAEYNQAKEPPKDSSVQAAEAAVQQAEVQLRQQQLTLQKYTLKAPMDGVVVEVNGNAGEIPANNTPVIVMDNSDSEGLEILAQVSQSDIGKIKAGMKATVSSSSYADKKFNAEVTSIYPEATTESGVTTYKVLLSVENKEGLLKPGMTTNVAIEVGTHTNVLYIPAAALRDQNGTDGVFVAGNASTDSSKENPKRSGQTRQSTPPYRFQPVKIGLYGSDRVEIVSGLQEGEQVVLQTGNPASSASRPQGGFGIPGMGGSGGLRGVR